MICKEEQLETLRELRELSVETIVSLRRKMKISQSLIELNEKQYCLLDDMIKELDK